MQGINKVQVEAVSIKEVKTGQHGDFWPYGIKVNGEWHNGLLSNQNQVDGMLAKKGQEVELFFYVDEKYGNKVRFVTDKDRKEAPKEDKQPPEGEPRADSDLVRMILKRIEALEKDVKGILESITPCEPETPITDQVNEDAKAPIDTTDENGNADDLEEKQMDDLPF